MTTRRGLGAALGCAALLLGACSGGSSAPDAGAGGGGDAGGGGGNGCPVRDGGACTSQTDCEGRSDIDLVMACLPGAGGTVCTYRAVQKPNCLPDEPTVTLQVNLSPAVTLAPQSLMLRSVYPARSTGAAPSCAELLAQGDLPDGGSGIDADPTLNLSFWNAVHIAAGSGAHTFSVTQNLVRGDDLLLEVEAFSGGVDTNSNLPTGIRLARGCLEHQSITAQASPLQNISIDLQ